MMLDIHIPLAWRTYEACSCFFPENLRHLNHLNLRHLHFVLQWPGHCVMKIGMKGQKPPTLMTGVNICSPLPLPSPPPRIKMTYGACSCFSWEFKTFNCSQRVFNHFWRLKFNCVSTFSCGITLTFVEWGEGGGIYPPWFICGWFCPLISIFIGGKCPEGGRLMSYTHLYVSGKNPSMTEVTVCKHWWPSVIICDQYTWMWSEQFLRWERLPLANSGDHWYSLVVNILGCDRKKTLWWERLPLANNGDHW